ncbi:MAG: M23 family metallopeptidase [Desulfarculus sp.]|nr:M23 family metallopeptidase [Desulfarculus sp.]
MRFLPWAVCLLSLLAGPALAAGGLEVWPAQAEQGQPLLVKACPGQPAPGAEISLEGRRAPLAPAPGGCLVGAVGVDLDEPTGPALLEIRQGERVLLSRRLTIKARGYGTRQITVDGKFMELKPEDLARHQEETAKQKAVYASRLPSMLWSGPWQTPLDSAVVGVFGRRSLVNGQPRSPHGGVDLRGGVGTPVKAPAVGRVALVLDTYFSGLLVLIDHGLGVVSGYRHLSRAMVEQGRVVQPGQVIGLVGASGRVTGPHLHFDVRLAGARVDPLAWILASRQLDRWAR